MFTGREGLAAWSALGALIMLYELVAPPDQLLSEAVDRALLTHPLITRLGIAIVALHLVNAIPERLDPVHQLAIQMRRYRHG